jgi:hypothetical protein
VSLITLAAEYPDFHSAESLSMGWVDMHWPELVNLTFSRSWQSSTTLSLSTQSYRVFFLKEVSFECFTLFSPTELISTILFLFALLKNYHQILLERLTGNQYFFT